MSTVGQLLSPHPGPSPWAPSVARCHPPFPKPWDWRRGRWKASRSQPSPSGTQASRASCSSLLGNLILGAGGEGNPGISFSSFFKLMSSLNAPALNSWAHLRAGPGPPIISPLGLHLDNAISLPPLWLGLPAPEPLARGGVSWGHFGGVPRCAHAPLLARDVRVTFLSRTPREDPSLPASLPPSGLSLGLWECWDLEGDLETPWRLPACLSFPPPWERCPPSRGSVPHSTRPPTSCCPQPCPSPTRFRSQAQWKADGGCPS